MKYPGARRLWSPWAGGGGGTIVNNVTNNNTIQQIVSQTGYKDFCDYATASTLPNTPTYNNGTAGVGATLTSTGNHALSVDGVTPLAGQRILVKNQTAAGQNGLYSVTAVGSGAAQWVLTRTTDFDGSATGTIDANDVVPVYNATPGATNNDTIWLSNVTKPATVGTTAITFSQVPGTTTILRSGGGGGTSASASAPYVLGAPGKALTSLANRITIPGDSGSYDAYSPTLATAFDDEFDSTWDGTGSAPGGWTLLPNAPTHAGFNGGGTSGGALSHFFLRCPTGPVGADKFFGIIKQAPAYPFVVTAKLSAAGLSGNSAEVVLGLTDSSVGNGHAVTLALQRDSTFSTGSFKVLWQTWNPLVPGGGGNATQVGSASARFHDTSRAYLMINATNNNSMDLWASDGDYIVWNDSVALGVAAGLTAGNVYVFLGADPGNATDAGAMFDWIRFYPAAPS